MSGNINTVAPLKNVALCNNALKRSMDRARHLPGIIAFYGPSGIGKTFSAAYTANKHRAYLVEAKSSWTRRDILINILLEMGIKPNPTISSMVEQIAEQLVLSRRPLIVDEMDHIINKHAPEIIRDIYDASGATILIIGEEHLENKLRRWERFHNRVLEWVPGQYGDIDDTKILASLYASDIAINADLLEQVRRMSGGIVSRICINLERIRQFALVEGLDTISLNDWGQRDLYTGTAPERRA